MGLFEERLKQARNVHADVEEQAIKDFDKVIARGEELHKKRERATTAHLVRLDSLHASLDGFEKSIEEYANNGAPPLDDGDKPVESWKPPR